MPQLHLVFGNYPSPPHLKCARRFFKKIAMLINRTVVSQMLPLFSRKSPGYIEISLLKTCTILQKFWKSLMGMHDKAFKISQRKLKIGEIRNLGGEIFILPFINNS